MKLYSGGHKSFYRLLVVLILYVICIFIFLILKAFKSFGNLKEIPLEVEYIKMKKNRVFFPVFLMYEFGNKVITPPSDRLFT